MISLAEMKTSAHSGPADTERTGTRSLFFHPSSLRHTDGYAVFLICVYRLHRTRHKLRYLHLPQYAIDHVPFRRQKKTILLAHPKMFTSRTHLFTVRQKASHRVCFSPVNGDDSLQLAFLFTFFFVLNSTKLRNFPLSSTECGFSCVPYVANHVRVNRKD